MYTFYDEQDPSAPQGGGSGSGIVGALVQTGGMLLDSYWNRKTAKENTDKTIAANKSESELAYQRQVDMWNRQNAYNSPAAQMARFKDAGLNPHLIYGQGSAGNANSMPQYQPANMQYRYESGNFGTAIASVIPYLMQVGSWMQDMRAKEVQIRGGEEGIMLKQIQQSKLQQLIDYLEKANPSLLKGLEQKNELMHYNTEIAHKNSRLAGLRVEDMVNELAYKWGDDGIMAVKKAYEKSRLGLSQLDLDVKKSWSNFDITNPQALIQLVLSGVMGMAGQTLRMSTHRNPVKRTEVQRGKGWSSTQSWYDKQ